MSGHIIGQAYERGRGLCLVEQLRPGSASMILTPLNNPNNRVIRHRDAVRFRRTKTKETT